MLQHFIAKDVALGIEAYEYLDVATKAALVGRLHGGANPSSSFIASTATITMSALLIFFNARHLVYYEGIDGLLIGLYLLIGTDIKHRLDT